MARKSNSSRENSEPVRESDGGQGQSNPTPADPPETESPADVDEQLRTEVEEFRRQILELEGLRDQDGRATREAEWLARIADENPDPVLQVSIYGMVQYRNPASIPLCRRWNPSNELVVPPAIHQIIKAAHGGKEVIHREMTFGEQTYLLTVAPAAAPAKYVNIYARDPGPEGGQAATAASRKQRGREFRNSLAGLRHREVDIGQKFGLRRGLRVVEALFPQGHVCDDNGTGIQRTI